VRSTAVPSPNRAALPKDRRTGESRRGWQRRSDRSGLKPYARFRGIPPTSRRARQLIRLR
jgi:hypothetical protein